MKNFLLLMYSDNRLTSTLDINIVENNEITIQIANINQNHLIIFIQKTNNIIATTNPVTFESHIADHDFLNHILQALCIFSQFFNSSLILSNINIFASIAIPIDNINHAIDAIVKTIANDLITVKTNTIYINNAILAINHENLYIIIKNISINIKPDNQAIINF
jgi:hypothetical protein